MCKACCPVTQESLADEDDNHHVWYFEEQNLLAQTSEEVVVKTSHVTFSKKLKNRRSRHGEKYDK